MASYKGIVKEIINEAPSVKVFKILRPDSFDYRPGQFVMLSLGNVKNESGQPLKKSYSFASSPLDKDYLEFCIKINPEGHLTPYLDKLKIGNSVNLEGPFGKFLMEMPKKNSKKYVFIATGTGIAPLMSMIRSLLPEYSVDAMLIYGVRSPEDFCYQDELDYFAEKYKNFKIYPTISAKEIPPSWKFDVGRVTAIIGKYVKANEVDSAYICGNPEMVKDTISCLMSIGVPEVKIHREQW